MGLRKTLQYFVIHPNGQKYGPADIATLNQWIVENRLSPTTEVEDAATMQRLQASSVPGLNFGAVSSPYQQATGVQNPYATPGNPAVGSPNPYAQAPNPYAHAPQPSSYQTAGKPTNGNSEAIIGWIFAGIGTLCCFSLCGIIFNIVGLVMGYQAKQKGNSQGTAIMILSGIMLGISVLLVVLGVAAGVLDGLR